MVRLGHDEKQNWFGDLRSQSELTSEVLDMMLVGEGLRRSVLALWGLTLSMLMTSCKLVDSWRRCRGRKRVEVMLRKRENRWRGRGRTKLKLC